VVQFLDALKAAPEDRLMQVAYAFYDCDDAGRPLVLCDPDYQSFVAPAVVGVSEEPHFNALCQPLELPELEEADATEEEQEGDEMCVPCTDERI